ncbi:MAG: DUF3604 domain-containing protein [Candidatus Binatia bacterium]
MVSQSKALVMSLWVGVFCAVGSAFGQTTSLYWGDTHLHTAYSPDAYVLRNQSTDPDTAYRYAKGLPVVHPYHRARVQIHTPLDFLVVSDHSEYMGVMPNLFAKDPDPALAGTNKGKELLQIAKEGRFTDIGMFIIRTINESKPDPELNSENVRRTMWNKIIDAAERHNDPGKFTTFLGWEWTSTTGGANLHRIVFLKEGKTVGEKFLPYSAFDSDKPEDLWQWLDTTSQQAGASFISIPHNSNLSKGLMFAENDSAGRPITAEYARTRIKWEPVVEMTQIKGDSETHPVLSPSDEFADYERFEFLIDVSTGKLPKGTPGKGDYIRSALQRGLEIDSKIEVNPYKFGLIGSTDSHTALSSAEEDNFHGKFALDSIPEHIDKDVAAGLKGYDMSAAGMVAVWATENTRAAIFDAFQRKEVYATTGPRIQVRFFGGWEYQALDAQAKDVASVGYKKGVPMGGDLTKAPEEKAPSFLIHAVKDPIGANLDRIQIIKGYLDQEGTAHEKIYNVALSDGRKETNGKVPHVGNTVDLKTARYTNSIGDAQLATVWTDPDFDARTRAFYYVRVLQIPTPRHSLYDTVALGVEHSKDYAATIQERAYSSPIWYTP